MVLREDTYLTRDGLWRELDALGEDRVRLRLAEGAYRERTRLLVEEWLRERAHKRALAYETNGLASSPGRLEPMETLHIERRDDKSATVAATAAVTAALMATIAATVSVLTYLRPP
jgi:hypothetical protein